MLRLLIVLFCLMSTAARAELRLLDPTLFTFEYYDVQNNRDLYLGINDEGSTKFGEGGEAWRYGAATNLDFDIASYDSFALYLHNRIHMAATQCCVRHVGWEWEAGVRAGPHVDLFWYHHSQHVLDLERQDRRFPLINYYGVRFVMIEKGRK